MAAETPDRDFRREPSGERTRLVAGNSTAWPWAIAAVLMVIEPGFAEVAPEEIPGDWHGTHIPVIGKLAAGPTGIDTEEAAAYLPGQAASYIRYTGAPPRAFGLRIAGDSMEPDYRNGDMVVFDGDRPCQEGLCAVLFKDEAGDALARFKRLRRQPGGFRLESLNPKHRPLVLPADRFVAAFHLIDHLPRIIEHVAR